MAKMTDLELMKWAFKRWEELKPKYALEEGWDLIAKELSKLHKSERTGAPLTGNSLRQKVFRIKKGHGAKLKSLPETAESDRLSKIRWAIEAGLDPATTIKLIKKELDGVDESL